MEKLELKHLAGYLPYGLKGNYNVSDVVPEYKYELRGKELRTDNIDFFLQYAKPILRPLSDLTKEIEVNGEKFVPIDWLRKNINKCIHFSDNRFMDYDDGKSKNILHYSFYDVFSDTIDVEEIIEFIQKLYEWHFDIHGLIEKGLAIDINTLS